MGLACDKCGKMFVTERLKEKGRCTKRILKKRCEGSLRLLATFPEVYKYSWGAWLKER